MPFGWTKNKDKNNSKSTMVFSSNIFLLFFLPIFLLAYFVTPQRFRNYTLLLASLVFYAYGAPDFILILVAACVVNFFLVKGMVRAQNPKTKKGICLDYSSLIASMLRTQGIPTRMEIGYIVKQNMILSKLAEQYIRELERYLKV